MNKGFTLLELLIVITILAVLAGAMIPLFKSSKADAQDAKTKADLDAIKSASVMFKYDTATWPSVGTFGTQTCLTSNATSGCPTTVAGWNGPYLTDWASDPWANRYATVLVGTTLYSQSYGPDKDNDSCASGKMCGVGAAVRTDCDFCVTITADVLK